jgi:hypothetical protein
VQPFRQPFGAVPLQAIETVANWVKGILARVFVDRLMRGIFAEPAEAVPLQMDLHRRDVAVDRRPRLEVRFVTKPRPQQHFGTEHFIVTESAF